jgi:hypothetical protein
MCLTVSAVSAKEAKPMDSSQALASPPKPAEHSLDLITPPEVWASLSLNQQNCLLQTLVRICREALLPVPVTQEAGHE